MEMLPRSVTNMSRSNSESSLLSSYECGVVTVYQCYMVRFASVTGRPVVGCNLVVLYQVICLVYTRAYQMLFQAYYKAAALKDEFSPKSKLSRRLSQGHFYIMVEEKSEARVEI